MAGEKVQKFISNYTQKFDWNIDNVVPYRLVLQKSFPFHSQKTKKIDVDVYRFIKKKEKNSWNIKVSLTGIVSKSLNV